MPQEKYIICFKLYNSQTRHPSIRNDEIIEKTVMHECFFRSHLKITTNFVFMREYAYMEYANAISFNASNELTSQNIFCNIMTQSYYFKVKLT